MALSIIKTNKHDTYSTYLLQDLLKETHVPFHLSHSPQQEAVLCPYVALTTDIYIKHKGQCQWKDA